MLPLVNATEAHLLLESGEHIDKITFTIGFGAYFSTNKQCYKKYTLNFECEISILV